MPGEFACISGDLSGQQQTVGDYEIGKVIGVREFGVLTLLDLGADAEA